MGMMITEIYDALKEAGVSDDRARKAAEAVAAYDNRLPWIENELTVLRWMVGVVLAMTVAILWRVFSL